MKIRIIPKIEVKGKNLIKGLQFDGLKVLGDPIQATEQYYKDGADEIFYVDIVASLYEQKISTELVKQTSKKISIPLMAGGGIRTSYDIEELLINGADKVAINTAAHRNQNFIKENAKIFGSQCIIRSMHAKFINNQFEVFSEHGRERTNLSLNDCIKKSIDDGCGELIISSVDREGSCLGLDLKLLDTLKECQIPIIFGGGIGRMGDVNFLKESKHKIDALVIASALHYKYFQNNFDQNVYESFSKKSISMIEPFKIFEIKEYIKNLGIEVRDDKNI